MILSAKSKTFLVGEYCVTCGGSAIVLCTSPSFLLKVGKKLEMIKGIKSSSPAFAFYKLHADVYRGLFINFYDPHCRAGGFGASSAQFAMLYKLKKKIEGNELENESISNEYIAKFLQEYHSIAQHMKANFRHSSINNGLIKPSGADCLAQLHNSNIYFNSSTNEVEKLEYWPFTDINFVIIRTGEKLPTYRHLCQLSAGFIEENSPRLSDIVEGVREAWKKQNSDDFVEGVRNFGKSLQDLGLVATKTKKILEEIIKLKEVVAAKGCGAMGADTILVVFEDGAKEKVMRELLAIEEKYI